MQVVKRDGNRESVSFDAIRIRIQSLCNGLNIDPIPLCISVIDKLHDGITTAELDMLAAETAAINTCNHPDFAILAARIAVSNLHKQTDSTFSLAMKKLFNYRHPVKKMQHPLITEALMFVIDRFESKINGAIDNDRDYELNYFGYKTLEKSYLMRSDKNIVERPQYMWMRVSLGIHIPRDAHKSGLYSAAELEKCVDLAIETYNCMSQKEFTHASPTLFASGTPNGQLASCFLVAMKEDSIDGIYDTLKQCAKISQGAGGIGLSVSNIRAKGSYIAGTNGQSNGLVPMLQVFNSTARYVDQGGQKRPGAIAIYLEPWHADVEEFINLRKNTGHELQRARDLFLALWIPDLFMRRVIEDGKWSLFCPAECPGLCDTYGKEFEELYERYENEGRARKTLSAVSFLRDIVNAQIETGTPYILYKDACNNKSNQQNLGIIRSSNLCTEIVEYSSPEETAVCNLASISLPSCVIDKKFDFNKLCKLAKIVTRNLNKVIDTSSYPVPEAERSNKLHRPIGIGVQGLTDVFFMLGYDLDSKEAMELNNKIFETIYFGAMESSNELAEKDGAYATFDGSPLSQGLFQFDLWNKYSNEENKEEYNFMWNWDGLREKILKYGVRNSLLVAPMPTASTSQIFGNIESFEPMTNNLYTRRVNAGEFIVVNQYLVNDLIKLNLWNKHMKEEIERNDGSVQNIAEIPETLRRRYRTGFELSQKTLIDLAAGRGRFIDQSQSLNLYMTNPTHSKLAAMHVYSWKKGLKTGQYYLRSNSAAMSLKFNLEHKPVEKQPEQKKIR